MKLIVFFFVLFFASFGFAIYSDGNYSLLRVNVIGSGKIVSDGNFVIFLNVGEPIVEKQVFDSNYYIALGFYGRPITGVIEEVPVPSVPPVGYRGGGGGFVGKYCVSDADCLTGLCLGNKCFVLMTEVEFLPDNRFLSVFPAQDVVLPKFSVRNLTSQHFVFDVSFECPSGDDSCVDNWCSVAESEKRFDLGAIDSFSFSGVRCVVPDKVESVNFFTRLVLTEVANGKKSVFPISFSVLPRGNVMLAGFSVLGIDAVGILNWLDFVLGFGLVCFGSGNPFCAVRLGVGLPISSINVAMLLVFTGLLRVLVFGGRRHSFIFLGFVIVLFGLWWLL